MVRLRSPASGLVCHVGKPEIDFLEIFSSRPGENAPGHQQMMRDASLGRGILIGQLRRDAKRSLPMKSDFPPRGTQRIRPKFGTVRQRRRFSDLAFLPCLWTKWTLDGPTAPCVKTGMRSDARSASYGRFGNIASAEARDGQEACVPGPNTLPEEGKTAGLADPRFPGLMANRSAALAERQPFRE